MVEACVSSYSQTVAMCPGAHKRQTEDGGTEVVTNSALARILKRPNDYESMSDFLLNATRRLYTKGEAYGLAIRNDRGEIKEIHRMRDGQPVLAVDGSIFYRLWGNEIVEQRFDLDYPIPARDVLHIRLHTTRHPLRGESPILSVALDLALSGAALNQQTAFYINQARPSFMLETDQQLNAEQTQSLRQRWDEQTKGDNAGGTPILAWGLKAKPVTISANDGRLADILKLSDQNVALAFRMPLQILGIGGTPFASTEALMSAWKSTGLGFALNHIEEAFGLLFGLKGMPDEYLEFDTEALLRSSFKELIESLTNASGKLLTTNEARAKIGKGRKPGGDELYVQMQDIPLSMAGKSQQQALATTDKSEAAEDPLDDDAADARIVRTIEQSVASAVSAMPVGFDAEAVKVIVHEAVSAIPKGLDRADLEAVLLGFKAVDSEREQLSEDEAARSARSVLDAVFAEVDLVKLLPAPAAEDRAVPRTLYIRRDVLNADEIIAWAKGQGFVTALEPNDMHVTIISTTSRLDWIKVGSAGEWSSEDDGRMTIAPGGPRLISQFGEAVVLQFASSRLTWRFEDIVNLGAYVKFPEYQPHVTITWQKPDDLDLTKVEPYRGAIVLGPEIFEEVNEDWKSGIVEKQNPTQLERSLA